MMRVFTHHSFVCSDAWRHASRRFILRTQTKAEAMLASVLKSSKAVQVNIAIMRSFVMMRRMLEENKELKKKIEQLESKYDKQFAVVFEAIKQLIHQESKPRTGLGLEQKKIRSKTMSRVCPNRFFVFVISLRARPRAD